MKNLLALALVALSMVFAHADWGSNYKAALAQAKSENKLVLLNFTGSDWCPSCHILDKEVFAQPAFKQFADKNYVLVTVDFPESKELPAETKEQNLSLSQKFEVDGFPTLLVVNADGKELGRQTGYGIGSGPKAVIAKLKTFNK